MLRLRCAGERWPRRKTDLCGFVYPSIHIMYYFIYAARYGTTARYITNDKDFFENIFESLNEFEDCFRQIDITYHSLEYHVPIFRLNLAKV